MFGCKMAVRTHKGIKWEALKGLPLSLSFRFHLHTPKNKSIVVRTFFSAQQNFGLHHSKRKALYLGKFSTDKSSSCNYLQTVYVPNFGRCPKLLSTKANQKQNESQTYEESVSSFANKSSKEEEAGNQKEKEKSLKGMKEKYWDLVERYGPVMTVYWGSLYVTGCAGIYLGLNYTGPELGLDIARKIHLDSLVNLNNIDPRGGNFLLSLLLNEAAEVVRLPFAIVTVPFITRRWERLRGPVKKDKKKKGMAALFKEHGAFFLGYWTFLWVSTGIGCYTVIETIGPEAALNGLRYAGADQLIDLESINPAYYNLGFAIAINELIEPIRLPFTLATLTTVKRMLGRDQKPL